MSKTNYNKKITYENGKIIDENKYETKNTPVETVKPAEVITEEKCCDKCSDTCDKSKDKCDKSKLNGYGIPILIIATAGILYLLYKNK
jgi:hypothetical protein